ncbi:hypothetical protein PABG_01282 [Paracoccidioides brasiliensis Pb03]|nr:hypothetical protein PABG_01282 [Paracoccidioides brasiliensis Pb03]
MTANTLDTVVFAIPSSERSQLATPVQLDASISFELRIGGRIRTLSTTNAGDGFDIRGLLYVADLDPEDPCKQMTAPFVPANATRKSNLPNVNILISIAPWVSPTCTLSFLAAQSRSSPLASIFYRPDASTDIPPPMDDPIWDLNDGDKWKAANKFPVYAIPGEYGTTLMRALSEYSGDLAEVPHGRDLARTFDDDELIRLYSKIGIRSNGSSLPSIWVFLLAVLGILIGIILSLSIAVRLVQIHRRGALERRVAAGEVDLETLGIRRLNVPQNILDKMPLYIHHELGKNEFLTPPPTTEVMPNHPSEESHKGPVDQKRHFLQLVSPLKCMSSASEALFTQKFQSLSLPTPSLKSPTTAFSTNQRGHNQLAFSQTTCSICLDDYVSGETTVRQLPCQHLFHPECIDNFLLQNSSLCPVCKKSVLPRGYCPEKITHVMVRQERLARQLREVQNRNTGWVMMILSLLPQLRANERRSGFRNPVTDMLRQSRNAARATVTPPSTTTSQHLDNSRPSRQLQEETRVRAMEMLGGHPMVADGERARHLPQSKCTPAPNILIHVTYPLIMYNISSGRGTVVRANISVSIGLKVLYKVFPAIR